jgi:hypothetical protein
VIERQIKYYENNKHKLNEKHLCSICGGSYKVRCITAHTNTKRHTNALNQVSTNAISEEKNND